MPRMRTIKPEFWVDEDLTDHPRDVRLFYIGLWNLCDEWGVFEYRPKRIKARLFPFDDDVTQQVIREWLDVLVNSGHVYVFDHESDSYGFIPSLMDHQKFDNRCTWRYAEPPLKLTESSPSYQRRLGDEAAMKQRRLTESSDSKGIGKGFREEVLVEEEEGVVVVEEGEGVGEGETTTTAATWQACRGKEPTQQECEALIEWEEAYGSEDVVDAIKEAGSLGNQKVTVRYVETILLRWAEEGKGNGEKPRNRGQPKEHDPEKYFKGKFGHLVQR